MLTVLTPTGARQQSLLRCHQYLMSQTYSGPLTWLVVDDGPQQSIVPSTHGKATTVVIRPETPWQEGQNTLGRNLLAGLRYFVDGGLVIMEDDDKYAPWWLQACEDRLASHCLIGESHSLYVNTKSGTETHMGNTEHASLCSTALRDHAVEHLKQICLSGGHAIDLRLWKRLGPEGKLYAPEPHRGVTGMKGGPGRPGIGVGHRL